MNERPLLEQHGSAKREMQRPQREPPDTAADDTVAEALAKLSEALETVEHARGLLYGFHRLVGAADLTLQEAVELMRKAGADDLADEIDEVLVGRDVVPGHWSFQLMEGFDDGYWTVFRDADRYARERLGQWPRHVREAEMRQEEQDPARTDE